MYYDRSEPPKNTEEVPSIGEGQPMQPVDDQPLRPSLNEHAHNEQFTRQNQGAKITRDLQREAPGGGVGEQGNVYPGMSEQALFPSPPASYQSGIANQPDQAAAPELNQPGQPGAMPAPLWNYPPHPEQYQDGMPGQPVPGPYNPASQPVPGAIPGQFGQQHNVPPTPFHSSATVPVVPLAGGAGGPVASQRSGWRTGTLVTLAILLALVFGTGIFAGWQFGRSGAATSPVSNSTFQPGARPSITIPQPNGSNADSVREAVINKVQPAIVQINVSTGSQQALGSGVIIDGRGYVVTNNHVVTGAKTIQVTLANNQVLAGKVIGTDAVDDLAVIKITPPAGGLATVTMGDSSQLRAGQEVLAIGSPLGNAETVTRGIVSALNRNVSEGQNGPTLPDAIQTDAPINPGNSGGALVDLQGNLVGMPTLNAVDTEFNTPANGLGFAIPVNRIRYIAQQIITDGHVSHTGRAVLGVTVTTVTPNVVAQNHLNVNTGVLVVEATASGPSAAAGIKTGDVIVQLGAHTINSTTDLSAALLQEKPGDSVPLKVNRGGQQFTLNVTLGELAAS